MSILQKKVRKFVEFSIDFGQLANAHRQKMGISNKEIGAEFYMRATNVTLNYLNIIFKLKASISIGNKAPITVAKVDFQKG